MKAHIVVARRQVGLPTKTTSIVGRSTSSVVVRGVCTSMGGAIPVARESDCLHQNHGGAFFISQLY